MRAALPGSIADTALWRLACRFVLSCRRNREKGKPMTNQELLGRPGRRPRERRHPGGRPDPALRPSTPVIQLPPPLAPSQPFRIEEISRYDERGPAWYWNNISCGEHTGTHFDAPAHWITGRELPDAHTDTIPPQLPGRPRLRDRLLPGRWRPTRTSCSSPPASRPGRREHGRIPAGSWVLMRTDWSRREDPAAFLNASEDGPHVPGAQRRRACGFLVEQRDIRGWGVEAVGTDAGQAFAFEPPFPAHNLLHGAGKFGLASLCHLDQLPPTGPS